MNETGTTETKQAQGWRIVPPYRQAHFVGADWKTLCGIAVVKTHTFDKQKVIYCDFCQSRTGKVK